MAVLGDAPLGGLAEVVPEAPPVRDLHGLRGADGGALGEERRTVTAHHLDSWPLGQPSGQARGLPVGQQVDGPAGFDVHEDSSVVAALAGGVLVDAEHARSGHFRFGKCVDQPQDRAAADRRTEYVGQAGAGPTREGETDRGQGRAEPLGPLAVPSGQAGYLLDERATSTLGVPAGEPADPQPEYDASSPARNISGKPNVGAVNPGGPRSTTRTRGARGGAPHINTHYRDIHVYRQHRDVRDRREQQLVQPEQDLIHSSELSAQSLLPLLVLRQLSETPRRVQPLLAVHRSHNLSQNLRTDSRCSPLR